MTNCTAPEIGKYLHAFELDLLRNEDAQAFEEHLLTCDYCFNEVAQFSSASQLLKNDTEIRELAKAAVRSSRTQEFLNRIKAALWPADRPLFLKPALTYFLLALTIYPAYLGFMKVDTPPVYPTQTIIMSGTRAANQSVATASRPVSLVFRVAEAAASDTLVVELKDSFGQTVFKDQNFTSLSPSRMGTLSFAENALTPGTYSLTVSSQSDSVLVEYMFLIK